MAANPFPGMVPYLEAAHLWPAFHHQLVATLDDILGSMLSSEYLHRIVKRQYAVADANFRPSDQPFRWEEYIEVRERNQGRLVTLLDVAGPSNKTTVIGRNAYLETRRSAKDEGANIVDIDLVLQGIPTFDFSRDGLPAWDYAVTVARADHADRYEIYTSTHQKRLPRFRLPLAKDDRDVVIDLNAAFLRCYEEGGFAANIDFHHEPPESVISARAHQIWEKEGRPHGRDKEHWYQAISELWCEAQRA
jgi:hypothetical protein